MFRHDIRKNIPQDGNVLDIGPGSMPYEDASVYLEKSFEPDEYYKQCGYTKANYNPEKTVCYDGGEFPFIDNQFDYVICSHVIEHVPANELSLFIKEMQRVGQKGYVEFPSPFYEIICFPEGHQWFINVRNGRLIFMDRNKFQSNPFHKCMRELWYSAGLRYNFKLYKEFFFFGFEWGPENTPIEYGFVDDFDELIKPEEHSYWESYLKQIKPFPEQGSKRKFRRVFARAIKRPIRLGRKGFRLMYNKATRMQQ